METGISDRSAPPADDRPCTEIEYVLEPDDYVACYMFLQHGSGSPPEPPRPKRPMGLFIASAVAFAFVLLVFQLGAPVQIYVAVLLVALSLLLLALVLALRGPDEPPRNALVLMVEEVRKLQAQGVIRIGRRNHVVLNDDGFVETNDYRDDGPGVQITERRETRVPWSEVQSIVVFDQHAIFTVVAKGCLFVPERAFPDEATFRLFISTAHELREAFRQRQSQNVTLGPVRQVDGRVQSPPRDSAGEA